MTERDDRLRPGNHRHQQGGTDQGIGAFDATNPADVPGQPIFDWGHDRTRTRTGSLSQ